MRRAHIRAILAQPYVARALLARLSDDQRRCVQTAAAGLPEERRGAFLESRSRPATWPLHQCRARRGDTGGAGRGPGLTPARQQREGNGAHMGGPPMPVPAHDFNTIEPRSWTKA
jgi:hypothetical protein